MVDTDHATVRACDHRCRGAPRSGDSIAGGDTIAIVIIAGTIIAGTIIADTESRSAR